jgi:hypothetical protein
MKTDCSGWGEGGKVAMPRKAPFNKRFEEAVGRHVKTLQHDECRGSSG